MSRIPAIPTAFARLAVLAGAVLALCACSAHPSVKGGVKLTSAPLSAAQAQALSVSEGPLNGLPPAQAMQATGADAEALNAERPFANQPIEPMRPFILKTDAADEARAVHCLAQAVYFEAAREPLKGQEAVAQVVLNRVRHPAFPKSVCGVVYQGASLPTGCQFTFTCNGALRQTPEPALWDRAVFVARQALAGFVDKDVGSATHYHAVYVAPYWAPTLVKMAQVGQHIFYRWTGAWGEPQAFTGHYAGREAVLTQAVLRSADPKPPVLEQAVQRQVTLGQGEAARTYKVADVPAPSGERTQLAGTLHASRPAPTADQVKAINAKLDALAARLDAPAAAASAQQTAQPAAAIASVQASEAGAASPSPAG